MTASTAPVSIALPRWTANLIQSRWAWCIAAVLFIGLRNYFSDIQSLHTMLGDTDDATRLVQVRELLAGASWYDLTLSRFGGSTPLVSHWSRLIDLPLALLMSMFGLIMSPAAAELAVRAFWPLLVLCFAIRLMLHEAELRSGQTGALLMLALVVTGVISLYQFNLGRIDHHGVMILCAVGGLIILARSFDDHRSGYAAGALLGLGMAIGYEGLAIVLPAVTVAAMAAVVETRWLEGIKRAAIAMAGILTIAIVLTIEPGQWLAAHCDALSVNMTLLVTSGAVGLTLVSRHLRTAPIAIRIGALAASAALGSVAYVATNPVCLGGPFALIDPAVVPIWLDLVTETHNISRLAKTAAPAAVVVIIYFTLAIAAQCHHWYRSRTTESAFLLFAVITATICGLWQVKFLPYASWLASFVLVLTIAELPGWRTIPARSIRLAAVVFCSQATLDAVAEPMLRLGGVPQEIMSSRTDGRSDVCLQSPGLRLLNVAPPGLVVASVDFGPFIVANSHHNVVSAPYHRIDRAILAVHRIQHSMPANAEASLRAIGADYVFECVSRQTSSAQPGGSLTTAKATVDEKAPSTFQEHLKAGTKFDFLEPIALNGTPVELKFWRIKPL